MNRWMVYTVLSQIMLFFVSASPVQTYFAVFAALCAVEMIKGIKNEQA